MRVVVIILPMHIWSIMTGLKPLSHWQRNIPGVFIQLPLLQMPKEIWHSLISTNQEYYI